ncbi:DUF885 family protein [Leptobacterium flavescens]|uniref:DUF885 family protein n=1 Tax=Leptobacterium flavescens TaxID=472055 RepID=A0A6P0UI32_9FLAO|nr:DUF885 domain-containing protein [Leptobacterium flavescens]NER12272.1 DUF885 family protein [Leptobacterium flavescens]
MKKLLVPFISLSLIFVTCKNDSTSSATQLPPIDQVFESYYQGSLKLNPLQATSAGDNRYNDQLPIDISEAYIKESSQFLKIYRDSLDLYSDEDLTEEQKLSKAILIWEIEQELKGDEFKTHLMPINQMFSLPLAIGQLGSGSGAQPFETVEDYNNWLKRLEKFTIWCDTALVNMKKGVAEGYVLPKVLIGKVIPQLESLANKDTERNIFFLPIHQIPDSITVEEGQELREKYTQIISEKIVPSLESIVNFLKTDYMEAGRTTSGVSAIPQGEEMYNYLIKYFTTTDMTADEIHQLGLSEVKRISSEMEKIKEEVGFEGDLKSFFDHVRNKAELMPFNDPQQVIENFNSIHEKMKANLEKLFDLTPKTAFEVRRTEAFREASASAQYNPGSLDGTRAGIFYVPIPNVEKYNVFSDEDLFLHEAIPGHHYQISLQQENENLPSFRKTLWYSAYGEGWALYTESLGKELGLYNDPYQYFGMLSAEMHRAIRLVVDTGLHAKGWTREQAIQYSLDNEAEGEASIISEIERYMAIPGQALSYKIGQLKIRELRSRAEESLGDKFDIREFHNKVLESGSLPLNLLEEKIDSWITSKK